MHKRTAASMSAASRAHFLLLTKNQTNEKIK